MTLTTLAMYRYCFKGFIKDQSATVPITFFTPGADDVVGYTCSELLAMHSAEDQQEIPPQIFDVEGQTNVFQIRFNQTGDATSFVLDQVFNKTRRHPALTNSPTAIEGKTFSLQNLGLLKTLSATANLDHY